MPARRTKLAPCIWRDKYGIAVAVKSREHGTKEERFPHDTSIKDLKAARDRIRVTLKSAEAKPEPEPPPVVTTLAEDVVTYLKAVKAMPTYSDRAHRLAVWLTVLGQDGQPLAGRRRQTIQPHEIQAQRDRWLTVTGPPRKGHGEKVMAPATVNNYLRALSNLYRVLDPKADNPVRAVAECDEPHEVPRAIPIAIANAILNGMEPSQTRARLRVLATTGIEQATFKRLTPQDVDLKARTVRLARRRKGRKGAPARIVPITTEAVAAFREVIQWDAWGAFSTSSVYKSWKAARARAEAIWNKDRKPRDHVDLSRLRPKDLRHTFGTGISLATGGNTATIQQFLGHATPVMADRYRQAAIPIHLRDAVEQMTKKRLAVSAGSGKIPRK